MRTSLKINIQPTLVIFRSAVVLAFCAASVFAHPHISAPVQETRAKTSADQLVEQARKLRSEWLKAKTTEAIKLYQKAGASYKNAGNTQNEIAVLLEMGDAQQSSGDPAAALTSYQEALNLSRRITNQRLEATSLNHLGFLQIDLSNFEQALDCGNKAHQLSGATGDRKNEAQSLLLLGTSNYNVRQVPEAKKYVELSLDLIKQIGDDSLYAAALAMLGHISHEAGERKEALRLFTEALDHATRANDLREKGKALNSLAITFLILGQKQEASENYRKAQAIFEQMGDSRQQAVSLAGLAYLYSSVAQNERALNYYHRALKIFRTVGDREGEHLVLARIVQISGQLSDKKTAIQSYEKIVTMARQINDPIFESYALNWLGDIYLSFDPHQALTYYAKALALSRLHDNVPTEAYTLTRLGYGNARLGEDESARTFYNTALKLMDDIQDREGESLALYNLAALEQKQNHLPQARELIERSLNFVESLTTAAGDRELRASYFATVHQRYEFYIDVLMQLHKQNPAGGFDAKALEASERSRARSLNDMLGESRADIRQGVDPQLLAQERSAKEKLSLAVQTRQKVFSRNHTRQESDDSTAEIVRLTSEYEEVMAQIRRRSPQYAALTQPTTLTGSQMQELLDDDTLMVEYALGSRQSYGWAITRDSIKGFELPEREKIENLVRVVYDGFTRNPRTGPALPADRQPTALESLSKILLDPLSPFAAKKRIVVVADGLLQYLPVSILQTATAAGEDRRLLARYEVVNLPSGSALATQRALIKDRKPAPQLLAVIADPVFSADDSRFHETASPSHTTRSSESSDARLGRALRDVQPSAGTLGLSRLYFSGPEADAIFSLIPATAGVKKVGFEASRKNVVNDELANFRIIHFSTHGLLDNELPELSGIVFSMFDQQGRPQNGFLQLYEIYNLKLSADLVVLSACQTALGKEVKGEGLVGLTRGFMHAGAPRVVATLWNVNDKATAELMTRFYREMLVNGLKPAAALRAAQLELSQIKQYQSPYYWAGFVLQGEWK